MKLLLFMLLIANSIFAQSWEITPLLNIPEAVTNNAVCAGFINDTAFVYTFAGLDDTKVYSGIHLRSYRYNTISQIWQSIPDLPDSKGKIAAAASRIKDTIYIIGGYHVAANGNETSSSKIHRYQISTNTFLTDGMDIPKAIDDHVQAVWRDSLIYVITGWSNTTNVNNVEIYNPTTNHWIAGTPLPNSSKYKSFGASGTIIGDTIYYFGGAKIANNFPIQSNLRIGIINPNKPSEITWQVQTPDPDIVGYRMAATSVKGRPYWIGGSHKTYNYNGIAYDGSGGVPPSNTSVYLQDINNTNWTTLFNELPMDLRGIASINDTTKFLVGGMIDNQIVSNSLFQLVWREHLTQNMTFTRPRLSLRLSPNPTHDILNIELDHSKNYQITISTIEAKIVLQEKSLSAKKQLNISHLPKGSYLLEIKAANSFVSEWFIKE